MKHCDERPRIDQEDRGFADRLAAHYAPPPWTSAERVGFDESLRARVERPQRRGLAVPALAAVAVAAGEPARPVILLDQHPVLVPGRVQGVGRAQARRPGAENHDGGWRWGQPVTSWCCRSGV